MTSTMHSGALSRRLRRHALPRRLRDLKCMRFLLRVRRTRRPMSRRMKSIHAPRGVRRLRLMRSIPVSSGLAKRIVRTNGH
jgi:hypothetical protein